MQRLGVPGPYSDRVMRQDSDRENFAFRQPQHIPLSAKLGLGILDFASPQGQLHSICHRVLG